MTLRFHTNDQFDYEIRLALGSAWRQGADAGEVLATASAVADGDGEAWCAAWAGLARKVGEQAGRAAAQGRTVSARDGWLRAAGYFGTALVGVDAAADPGPRLAELFPEHRACLDRFLGAWDPPAEPVAIPYEDTSLPGYLVGPPDAPGPLPTLIVNNGSDGPVSSAWTLLGAPAVARGYRALLFDGPGQQSMLFERGVTFRPDWENVITPVVDFLLARPDVDPRRLALAGVSQAGYWVPRALAFEHRIAAAVADPGVVRVVDSWWPRLGPDLRALWESGDRAAFDAQVTEGLRREPAISALWRWRAKPYGIGSPFDLLTEVSRYDVTPVAGRITTPLLVTDPDGEHFWPGAARELYDLLPGPKQLVRFTEEEGAHLHCEPMGRALFEQRVFDWLDDRLDRADGRRTGGRAAGELRAPPGPR
ncbi:alpha/beta hydrolase [Streptomyces capoamus]|uniref:Alpha/beta hydrolase n=1 Tax=Streptomyces capoamus TaxID=68183 RepID=A0A919KDE1_9ACTN|nr:dipeptidyl aminopeptidase [Streptomyces capoamus]GGW18311.1 alpha/beta hydrolase [Streptomyces libani subsp. rufus]GHG59375.1 alpha/beta hydrolase [Streptomyces capoamus]